MVSTISRRECIHQTTLNCNITPNISSILQRLFHGGRTEAARQHGTQLVRPRWMHAYARTRIHTAIHYEPPPQFFFNVGQMCTYVSRQSFLCTSSHGNTHFINDRSGAINLNSTVKCFNFDSRTFKLYHLHVSSLVLLTCCPKYQVCAIAIKAIYIYM